MRRDVLRRFIWLIDVFYDNNIRMYIQAEKPISELYLDKNSTSDFDEHFSWTWIESWLIEA